MARYVAFLRAINVGGHIVKMDTLRDLFTAHGFSNVETFIASGNVIFESKSAADKKLELAIEKRLESALGYTVATFVRSVAEIAAISVYQPFSSAALKASRTLNIGFLREPLSPSALKALMSLKTPIDDFHVQGRELYWLCRKGQSESTFSNKVFERAIQGVSTFRNATTIARLAAKYPAA
ncbi:MAG: DUF1697 domain-containing protein [Candidatus Solibacter usitatus]|nr:DUF1697 domain-containing protein [Candidatus Solibacter usitatus]